MEVSSSLIKSHFDAVEREDLSFHGLPSNSKSLLPCLNHGNEKRSRSFKGNRHIKICSEHFTLDDFINRHSSKKRSKANAVPSMFLWNKEKQKKVQPVKRSALEKLDQGRAKEEATDTVVMVVSLFTLDKKSSVKTVASRSIYLQNYIG